MAPYNRNRKSRPKTTMADFLPHSRKWKSPYEETTLAKSSKIVSSVNGIANHASMSGETGPRKKSVKKNTTARQVDNNLYKPYPPITNAIDLMRNFIISYA